MVFSVERPGIKPFLFALPVIMLLFRMVVRGIQGTAVNALVPSTGGIGNDWTQRSANPLLERQMQRLFVSSPVVFALE